MNPVRNPALDAELIGEVCRLALAAMPFSSGASTRAICLVVDETGVSVLTASPIGQLAATKALLQHGYRLEEIPAEADAEDRASGIAVRVTGWNREQLTSRRKALAAVIARMELTLPATIETTADRYSHLQGRIAGDAATYGLADALRGDLARRVTRCVGPLQRRRPSGITVPADVRALLSDIDRLTTRAAGLLTEHWHLAVRTTTRLDQLHHRLPPEKARQRAITELRAELRAGSTQRDSAAPPRVARTRPVRRTSAAAEPPGPPAPAGTRRAPAGHAMTLRDRPPVLAKHPTTVHQEVCDETRPRT